MQRAPETLHGYLLSHQKMSSPLPSHQERAKAGA